MGIGKGPASCPVGDFGDSSGGPIDFGALVTSRRFALQPWVDGGATEVENLARFALLQAIELERLTPLLTAVIAVRVGPGRRGSVKHSLMLTLHVLTVLATAIWRLDSGSSQDSNVMDGGYRQCSSLGSGQFGVFLYRSWIYLELR